MNFKKCFIAIGIVCMAVVTFCVSVPSVVSAVEYRLQDFMILVDDQLIIQGPADVLSFQGGMYGGSQMRTDLGSRNFIQIGGKARTRIPLECPTDTDVCLIAPHVALGNFACVSCVISDAPAGQPPFSDVGTAGRKGPTATENNLGMNFLNDTGLRQLPDLPAFPAFNPGGTDVIVPANGVLNLVPGDYRDLILANRSTVQFTSGIYNFRNIVSNTAGRYNLTFEADVEIRVKQFVRLAAYGNVNPTGADSVFLYVEGEDGAYSGMNRNQDGVYGFPAAFEYDGGGKVNLSFVYAPNGTMNLKGIVSYPTRWFGKSLQQISSLRMTLAQNDATLPSTSAQCACLTDFRLQSDKSLTLKGVNLKPETVASVGLFDASEDTLSPIYQFPQSYLNFVSTEKITIAPDVISELVKAGLGGLSLYLGTIYPVSPETGNTAGFCIYTNKVLDVPNSAPPPALCQTNADCPPGDYCRKETGDCNGVGTCVGQPVVCLQYIDPVCGCNGVTFSNAGCAAVAGINVAYPGVCQ